MPQLLSPHFKDKAIDRLTEATAQRYKQAGVFGGRRTHAERTRLSDAVVNQANWKLHELTQRYDAMCVLANGLPARWSVFFSRCASTKQWHAGREARCTLAALVG